MPAPFDYVEDLAAEASARAAETEASSRLPPDLMARVLSSGLLRVAVPPEYGGLIAPPADWFGAVVRCAVGDGSLGWQIGSAIAFNGVMAAGADPQFCQEFFADPAALLAGGVIGAGTATPVADGFEIEGEWTFCSGCWDATWLGGLCIERPQSGQARTHFVMVPAAYAERIATWDVVGLRGTSSDTVRLARRVVPPRWTFRLPVPSDAPPALGPINCYQLGPWPTAVAVAGTQLGIARRALDEVVTFATSKHRSGTTSALAAEQAFLRDLGAAEAAWLAAHAAVTLTLDDLWALTLAETPSPEAVRLVRLASTHASLAGAHIVRTCFDLAGASAIARNHPLARCHRDGTVLCHHATANKRTYETLTTVAPVSGDQQV